MSNKFNTKQYISILVMTYLGSIVLTHGNKIAKQDTWITLLYGAILAIPLNLLLGYIATKNPNKNIFQILKDNTNKFIYIIISSLYIFLLINTGYFTCRFFTEFVQLISLKDTPQYILGFLLIATCVYTAKFNMQVIARLSSFLLIIFTFFYLLIIILSFPNFNLEHIFPIHSISTKLMAKASFGSFINPYSDVIIMLAFCGFAKDSKSHYKALFTSILITAVLICLSSLCNILILGIPSYSDLYFPSYIATTFIEGAAIIERIESILSIAFLICIFVKIVLLIKASSIGLNSLIPKIKESHFIILVGAIIFGVSQFYFKNIEHFFKQVYNNFKPIFILGFFAIFTILAIVIFFKDRKNKKNRLLHSQ